MHLESDLFFGVGRLRLRDPRLLEEIVRGMR